MAAAAGDPHLLAWLAQQQRLAVRSCQQRPCFSAGHHTRQQPAVATTGNSSTHGTLHSNTPVSRGQVMPYCMAAKQTLWFHHMQATRCPDAPVACPLCFFGCAAGIPQRSMQQMQCVLCTCACCLWHLMISTSKCSIHLLLTVASAGPLKGGPAALPSPLLPGTAAASKSQGRCRCWWLQLMRHVLPGAEVARSSREWTH